MNWKKMFAKTWYSDEYSEYTENNIWEKKKMKKNKDRTKGENEMASEQENYSASSVIGNAN